VFFFFFLKSKYFQFKFTQHQTSLATTFSIFFLQFQTDVTKTLYNNGYTMQTKANKKHTAYKLLIWRLSKEISTENKFQKYKKKIH